MESIQVILITHMQTQYKKPGSFRHGKWYEMEVSELFAQCVCHELAHLEGHLFTEIVEEFVEVED